MNINLHIERLSIEGISVPHQHRTLLQATIESELSQLLAMNGLPSMSMKRSMRTNWSDGTIQLSEENNPFILGQQIAQAVHTGIVQ